jgi:outer membrane protein OmpA-like peptidoglycan-associated protein
MNLLRQQRYPLPASKQLPQYAFRKWHIVVRVRQRITKWHNGRKHRRKCTNTQIFKVKFFTFQSDTKETQEEYYNTLHNLRQLLKNSNSLLRAKDHNK